MLLPESDEITLELGGSFTPSRTGSHLPPLCQGPPSTAGLLSPLRKTGAMYTATMPLRWPEGTLQVFYLPAAPVHSNYFTPIIIRLHCLLGGTEEHVSPPLQMERSSRGKKDQLGEEKKMSSSFKEIMTLLFFIVTVVVLITKVIHVPHGHFFIVETNTNKEM